MYLKRKIDSFLRKWKDNDNRLPLIIKGARQVGKTESVLNFAKENYTNVVYINFALEPKYLNIVADGYTVDSIIKNITLLDVNKSFVPGNTLLFFDEIQENPDITTSLKAFKIDGNYDVICSGSMLGLNYNKIHSNSVGYKTDYEMYSMDFEEFLWGKGYSAEHIDSLFKHMTDMVPFNDLEWSVFSSLFLDYCVLGGMPAIVRQYIETGNFSDVLMMQRQILMDYEEDVRKYAIGVDQTKIISVFRNIPVQLAKENKKFQYSKLEKGGRARNYQGCIDWLKDAGVVSVCNCLRFPELPLKGNYDETRFKLYYPDTGLLIATLDDETQDDLRANKNLGVYKGALYENFIAEAFLKQGLGLYYFKRDNSSLEEDFFVRTSNALIPVEVKANDKRAKSLATLIKNDNYRDISWGIKLIAGNVGYANGIYTFPYFCAFLIKRYLLQRGENE